MRHGVYRLAALLLTGVVLGGSVGCSHRLTARCPTPASAGINTRDIIDPPSQEEQDRLMNLRAVETVALRVRDELKATAPPGRPVRHILCLSGGGSYGAYTAGVLCGWTERGDRPSFDVVTGISTGSLIAPLAFLGPKYDPLVREYYTTLRNRDVYRLHPVRGLLGESLADNAPLARLIDRSITPEMIAEIAEAHRQGRRLYVGTTEQEGKRFVVWDLGAIACRNGPGDLELIRQVLLGSAAIPGFFPPAKIDVRVDGRCYTERHVDGGVSEGIFFRPPYVPPGRPGDGHGRNAGVGDRGREALRGPGGDPGPVPAQRRQERLDRPLRPDPRRPPADVPDLYAERDGPAHLGRPGRGPDPASSTDFNPEETTALFEEGRRMIHSPEAWRTTPPGALEEEGETVQCRSGRFLTHQQRGPITPIRAPRNRIIPSFRPIIAPGGPPVSPLPD